MDTNVQAPTIFLFEELENIYNKGYANIWFMKCMYLRLLVAKDHQFTMVTFKAKLSIKLLLCILGK